MCVYSVCGIRGSQWQPVRAVIAGGGGGTIVPIHKMPHGRIMTNLGEMGNGNDNDKNEEKDYH